MNKVSEYIERHTTIHAIEIDHSNMNEIIDWISRFSNIELLFRGFSMAPVLKANGDEIPLFDADYLCLQNGHHWFTMKKHEFENKYVMF